VRRKSDGLRLCTKLSDAIRSYMGDSRRHLEGNTPVVETTNFNDHTEDGVAHWEHDKVASPPAAHTHKSCSWSFRAAHLEINGCEDLQVHPSFLVKGVKFDQRKAEKLLALRADLE